LKAKKRNLKLKQKNKVKSLKESLKPYPQKKSRGPERRPLQDGISIFNLIIPWKQSLLPKSQAGSKKQQQIEPSSHQTSLTSFLDPTKKSLPKQTKVVSKKNNMVVDPQNELIVNGFA
jgi:hypothetical protein